MKIEDEHWYWFELGYKCALMPELPTDQDKQNAVAWFELQRQLEQMRVKNVVKEQQRAG